MTGVSPREVLARVAPVIPAAVRGHVIVVGSLAAAYHLLGEADGAVRTKDIDCLLHPRVEAARAGREVVTQLVAAGWEPRAGGEHDTPGEPATPDADLPAVRFWPPGSRDWFLELLSAHEPGDAADRRWLRLPLERGHFGLPSYRHLDVAIHEAPVTESGLRCARPPLLALSNLLRNPTIRPETMKALVEGREIRRSNKDLGRVVAISRLAGPDAARSWPPLWERALRALHGEHWRSLADGAGAGIRALLDSEGDLEEAVLVSNQGLLAARPLTLEEFRREALRLQVDALDPFEGRV